MRADARLLDLLRRYPSARHLVSRAVFSPLSRRKRFQLIWAFDLWGGGASRSGRASSLDATRRLRAGLPSTLTKLGVTTLLDVPCGDFNWMSEVDLGDVTYVGIDIVPQIVERNRSHFGESPRRRFLVGDVTSDALPRADAVLCRDLLPHLSFRDALRALSRIRGSGARWLLSTTFPYVERNYDVVTGDFRAINLERRPFSLPSPRWTIDDRVTDDTERLLGVWDIGS
jgi:hypothetical protein